MSEKAWAGTFFHGRKDVLKLATAEGAKWGKGM